jgi:hypothetical protein
VVTYPSQVVVPCAENHEGHADRDQTLNQDACAGGSSACGTPRWRKLCQPFDRRPRPDNPVTARN